jgi:hypothetical protein
LIAVNVPLQPQRFMIYPASVGGKQMLYDRVHERDAAAVEELATGQ